jgi:DNA end-binding protein Ku
MGITLRYPYEVRDQNEYFDDIENEKVPKDMLDLALHIVETKKGTFEPEKFEDQYEDALKDLIRKKQKGEKIERPAERAPSNVVNLMDALRQSVKGDRAGAQQKTGRSRAKKSKKRIEGQREMLLPIAGKRVGKARSSPYGPAESKGKPVSLCGRATYKLTWEEIVALYRLTLGLSV